MLLHEVTKNPTWVEMEDACSNVEFPTQIPLTALAPAASEQNVLLSNCSSGLHKASFKHFASRASEARLMNELAMVQWVQPCALWAMAVAT